MDETFRTQTVVEKFQKELNHIRLQLHLLIMTQHAIADAVQIADELLQLGTKTGVNTVDDPKLLVEQVQTTSPNKLDMTVKSLENVIANQANLIKQVRIPTKEVTHTIEACFYSRKTGHLKNDCQKQTAERA